MLVQGFNVIVEVCVYIGVDPDTDGIAAVRHGLSSNYVSVTCVDANGTPVGYKFFMSVSPDEVEVAVVPGSGVVAVVVERRNAPS